MECTMYVVVRKSLITRYVMMRQRSSIMLIFSFIHVRYAERTPCTATSTLR